MLKLFKSHIFSVYCLPFYMWAHYFEHADWGSSWELIKQTNLGSLVFQSSFLRYIWGMLYSREKNKLKLIMQGFVILCIFSKSWVIIIKAARAPEKLRLSSERISMDVSTCSTELKLNTVIFFFLCLKGSVFSGAQMCEAVNRTGVCR